MPAYRRVIVKVSGEAFSGPNDFGIHAPTIENIVNDLVAARELGVTIGVVVGGGNLIRGAEAAEAWLSRPTADAMGMMGTVMNALVLEAALEKAGAPARTMSSCTAVRRCAVAAARAAVRSVNIAGRSPACTRNWPCCGELIVHSWAIRTRPTTAPTALATSAWRGMRDSAPSSSATRG